MLSPVHILRIGGVVDRPVVRVEILAELRALGLPAALAALTLAGIEVFQDSEKTHRAHGVLQNQALND